MKFKAKPEYFKAIKSGKKLIDYREAHGTFVNTETGEKVTRDITKVRMIKKNELPPELKDNTILFGDGDDWIIAFTLSKEIRKRKKI